MAISAFQISKLGLDSSPSFTMSNTLDFFRGEPGEQHIPFIWDDGDVSKEDSEAVKGFLDVPRIDPKVKARWGASAFTRLQSRIICHNIWDESAEPGAVKIKDGQISFQTLLNMLSPTFSTTFRLEDVIVVLKRSNLVLFGESRKTHVDPVAFVSRLTSSLIGLARLRVTVSSFLQLGLGSRFTRSLQDALPTEMIPPPVKDKLPGTPLKKRARTVSTALSSSQLPAARAH
eukprot:5362911-Amphidinium_carterae.2